jgi:hypothetical protein
VEESEKNGGIMKVKSKKERHFFFLFQKKEKK